MIIVTGAFGFIGSHLVKALNERGITDIIAVDDLEDGRKFVNLVDCSLVEYIDKRDFYPMLSSPSVFPEVKAVFHSGACSDTTAWNGVEMLKNNYESSKTLLTWCQKRSLPFIYASSAAVYGLHQTFEVHPDHEHPINLYGYSKLLFDQHVRRCLPTSKSQIVGLRYFNVYGPREQHKGPMASVAFQGHQQMLTKGTVSLFGAYGGYAPGQQRRDFIYVDDVVHVNLWFLDNLHCSGIFNCGTGRSEPFQAVAEAILAWHGRGTVHYIPMPAHLKEHYQTFTEADLNPLREVGYTRSFTPVAEGVPAYLDCLRS